MPTSIQDQKAMARAELLINLAYIRTNRETLSAESLIHAYDLAAGAMLYYLEGEEDLAREVANGRTSEHILEAAQVAEGTEA
jgi:transketolase C-terminal domain/subunit